MTRDKHHPDDETVPRPTWWLLNGAGKPPTWRQLERGAMARRREAPMARPREGKGRERGENEGGVGDEDAEGRARVEETASAKPKKAGAGAGAIGRLMSRLRNRPTKRPPSSDVIHEDGAAPEPGQAHEDKSRSDTSWHSTPEHPEHLLTHDSHGGQTS